MVAIGSTLMLVIYFKLNWLTLMFEKIPFVSRYKFMVENLETIESRVLTRILLLSLIRFTVLSFSTWQCFTYLMCN